MDGSCKTIPEAFALGPIDAEPQRNLIRGSRGTITLEPRIMDVLCLLAEHAGDVVSRDLLIEDVWHLEHGGDDSLSRAISVLRKAFRDAGAAEEIIETIPKRGYRLKVPVTAIDRFEPRPEPDLLDRSMTADHSHDPTVAPTRPSRSGALVWLAAACIALVFGGVGFMFASGPAPDTQTVTVEIDRVWLAPVEVASDAPTTERFASNLRAQMSSQLLANGLLTTLEAGGADNGQKFDITSRVDEAPDELRVTVNLVDHPSQLLLWSRVFEPSGEAGQAFDLTVSTRLAGVLGCMTRWRPDFRETPATTLALYARLCERLHEMKMGDLLTFTEPIYTADPENPYAISLQAWALVIEAKHQELDRDRDHFYAHAEALIAPILEADPSHPFANFVAGAIGWTRSGGKDLEKVEGHMRLASRPQAMPDEFYTLYSNFLRSVGRFSAAADMFYKAASNHPNDPELLVQMGWIFASMGEYGAMERQFARAAEINPDLWLLHLRRVQRHVFLGDDPGAALEFLSQAPREDYEGSQDYDRCYRTFLRLKVGELTDPALLETDCRGVAYHWPMRMYVALGEIDRAWALIEENADSTIYDETIIHFYPDMAPFRQDPRFWVTMDRFGLVDYWSETGRWPDFCTTEQLPVDCQTMASRAISETD